MTYLRVTTLCKCGKLLRPNKNTMDRIRETFEALKAPCYRSEPVFSRGNKCITKPEDAVRSATTGDRKFTSMWDRGQNDEVHRASTLQMGIVSFFLCHYRKYFQEHNTLVTLLGPLGLQSTGPRQPLRLLIQQAQSRDGEARPPEIPKYSATAKSELAESPGEHHDEMKLGLPGAEQMARPVPLLQQSKSLPPRSGRKIARRRTCSTSQTLTLR